MLSRKLALPLLFVAAPFATMAICKRDPGGIEPRRRTVARFLQGDRSELGFRPDLSSALREPSRVEEACRRPICLRRAHQPLLRTALLQVDTLEHDKQRRDDWHDATRGLVLASLPLANPGSIIRLARLARCETRTQTGRACGFTQSQISRIESGKAYAYDIRHLSRLASHLDIPPHLLGLAPAGVDPSEPAVNRRELVTNAAAAIAGVGLPAAFGRDRALRVAGAAHDEADAGFTLELVRSRWLGGALDDAPTFDLTEARRKMPVAGSERMATFDGRRLAPGMSGSIRSTSPRLSATLVMRSSAPGASSSTGFRSPSGEPAF